MKPKQNSKNKHGNNNKRLKQQRQQQQQQPKDRHEASAGDEITRTDDVKAKTAESTDSMTSSVVEQSAATTPNVDRQISADNINNSDNRLSVHSPGGDTANDHVTDRCAGDVTSDVEVADILHAAASAVNPDLGIDEAIVTSDPGVTEFVTFEPAVTEVIMSKTFTESTHPGREFMPICNDDVIGDVTDQPLSVHDSATTLRVRCELVSQPGTSLTSGDDSRHVANEVAATNTASGSSVTSSAELRSARGQLRDLASEFRHLQSLLDSITSPTETGHDVVDTEDSEEELAADDDWAGQSRVVYRYHLHEQGAPARRWIKRDDGNTTTRTEQTQEQHHEACVEDSGQRVERQTAEQTVQIDSQQPTNVIVVNEQHGQRETPVPGGGGQSVEELGMVEAEHSQQGHLKTHPQESYPERRSQRVDKRSKQTEEIEDQRKTGDILEQTEAQQQEHGGNQIVKEPETQKEDSKLELVKEDKKT